MKDYDLLNKEWHDTVAQAIAVAHWLENNVGSREWTTKREEFDALVEHADVLKDLLR